MHLVNLLFLSPILHLFIYFLLALAYKKLNEGLKGDIKPVKRPKKVKKGTDLL